MEKFCFSSDKNLFFVYQGGAWIFLEENFPGKRRNKTIGKDRREFQQSFGNHRLGKKKNHWKMTFFYLKLLLLPLAEWEKQTQNRGRFQKGLRKWKFLKIWAGISSSALGKARPRELGIPSWKRRQETVRNPNSHFGLFFHPGMLRDFGR